MKILKNSYQNGVSKTERKHISKNIEKMSKMDPQMGTHFGTHFGHLAPLCCPRQALGAKMTPKASPRVPGTSPSLNFHRFSMDLNRFCDDFPCHVGYFLLVCLISFLITLKPILQNPSHKFKLFGVASRVISALWSA